MADGMDKNQDPFGDKWLSNFEEECLDEYENDETNMDNTISNEHERLSQKLWASFQNTASAIAQLYKEGSKEDAAAIWAPFQNSASCCTTLYKDSLDVMKKCFELGTHYGYQKRSKEMLAWSRRNRRHIRREDLIGYLCGKTPPVRHKPAVCTLSRSNSVRGGLDRSSPRLSASQRLESLHEHCDTTSQADLQPFRDALAYQGLNQDTAAMDLVSPHNRGALQNVESQICANAAGADEFHRYILEEMSRHCDSRKRTASNDVIMGSPSRKRGRLH